MIITLIRLFFLPTFFLLHVHEIDPQLNSKLKKKKTKQTNEITEREIHVSNETKYNIFLEKRILFFFSFLQTTAWSDTKYTTGRC